MRMKDHEQLEHLWARVASGALCVSSTKLQGNAAPTSKGYMQALLVGLVLQLTRVLCSPRGMLAFVEGHVGNHG